MDNKVREEINYSVTTLPILIQKDPYSLEWMVNQSTGKELITS